MLSTESFFQQLIAWLDSDDGEPPVELRRDAEDYRLARQVEARYQLRRAIRDDYRAQQIDRSGEPCPHLHQKTSVTHTADTTREAGERQTTGTAKVPIRSIPTVLQVSRESPDTSMPRKDIAIPSRNNNLGLEIVDDW